MGRKTKAALLGAASWAMVTAFFSAALSTEHGFTWQVVVASGVAVAAFWVAIPLAVAAFWVAIPLGVAAIIAFIEAFDRGGK
jgi:hypothetical protein